MVDYGVPAVDGCSVDRDVVLLYRGIQVPPAPLVKTAPRVSEGSLETEGSPAPW